MLRNGTRVPRGGFAAAKSSSKWSFPCENGIFHALELRSRFAAAKWELLCCEVALVCQKWFRSRKNFCREGLEATNWFCSKVSISHRLRNLADPCFSPVFDPFLLCFHPVFALFSLRFLSDFFLSISLHFLPPEIIQKYKNTYKYTI